MNFARQQFNRMLATTVITAVVNFVSGIADTVFAGHLFGPDALAGINLVMPVNSMAMFVATTIAIGAAINRSMAVGKCDRETMDKCCSTGLWASLGLGVALGLMFLVQGLYYDLVGVHGEAREVAAAYCRSYWLVVATLPLFQLMNNLVCSDGGHRYCRAALVVNLVLKLGLTVPFAHKFGVMGLALATAVGQIAATAVLIAFLRSKLCTLVFTKGYSWRVLVQGLRFSMLDQLFMFGDMMKMLVVNIFVVKNFGESFLPVVSAFTAVSMLSCVQNATINAMQPLMGVYYGEENYPRVRDVAGYGLALTTLIGASLSAVVFAFPQLATAAVGLTDPALLPSAHVAARIAAGFMVFGMIFEYLNSFYLYTEHFVLTLEMIVLNSFVLPLSLSLILGTIFREPGLWSGLAGAPMVVLLILLGYVVLRFGRSQFPFLLPKGAGENIHVFDLPLDERSITATSEKVMAVLNERGLYRGAAVRAPLIVEEALMVVKDHNKDRRIMAEVTLDLSRGVSLTLRDDGEIFDITDSDASVSSLRSYLVANVMATQSNKVNLITTGINRNCFRF